VDNQIVIAADFTSGSQRRKDTECYETTRVGAGRDGGIVRVRGACAAAVAEGENLLINGTFEAEQVEFPSSGRRAA
jgi:hypothetical protein